MSETPLERLKDAIQELVNTSNPGRLVVDALVIWEEVRYDDEGDQLRSLNYACVGDGSSLAAAVGLASWGLLRLQTDVGAQS